MTRALIRAALVLTALALDTTAATAQTPSKPRPAAAPQRSGGFSIDGYGMAGAFTFASTESFDAILERTSAPIFGGGARIGIPLGGLFVDLGAWRLRDEGERVFVSNGTVHPLNILVELTMTPLEVSAGWQFRFRRVPKLRPYIAAGFTSMRYQESSDFSTPDEDVDETFNGYHVSGGAEYRLLRWMGAAGEFTWTTVPDAIGEGGVSAAFDEHDLGGRSFRIKILIGR